MTDKQAILISLVRTVAKNDELCDLLAKSALPQYKDQFVARLQELIPQERAFFSDLLGELIDCGKTYGMGTRFEEAVQERNKLKDKARRLHREIEDALWLRPDPARLQDFLDKIRREQVHPLPEPYPPYEFWVFETKSIEKQWRHHLEKGKQPDDRKTRMPLLELDVSRLVYDIKPDESIMIMDGDEMVLLVIRNFCGDARVLNWVDDVILEAVGKKRSARLEDPGKLTLMGYSAGSLSQPKFDWVKNLLRKTSPEDQQKLDYKTSSCFALFWNMLRNRVPAAVINDITDFCDGIGINRMDANSLSSGAGPSRTNPMVDNVGSSGRGTYMVMVDDFPIYYNDVALAPPSGAFATNYARHIHKEYPPHKYAAGWTTNRSAGGSNGGHFFLSQYGIRVQSAPNTVTIWQPRHLHGTSLQNVSPTDPSPSFIQSGMSIFTSDRIAKTWGEYVSGGRKKEPAPKDIVSEEL